MNIAKNMQEKEQLMKNASGFEYLELCDNKTELSKYIIELEWQRFKKTNIYKYLVLSQINNN